MSGPAYYAATGLARIGILEGLGEAAAIAGGPAVFGASLLGGAIYGASHIGSQSVPMSRGRKRKAQPSKRKAKRSRVAKNARTGGFIGAEVKFKDETREADLQTAATAAGAIIDPSSEMCLNGIAQGDGEDQRDGRRYSVTSLHIRGYVLFGAQAGSGVTSDHVRLLLVQDTQTNAAQMTAANVLDTAITAVNLQTVLFRNLEYTKRFRVLKDITVYKPTTGLAGNQPTSGDVESNGCTLPIQIDHSFKSPIKVTCTGTSNTVASIADNSFHVIGISLNSGNKFRYVSRVRFVD